jgi:hypothetical protein
VRCMLRFTYSLRLVSSTSLVVIDNSVAWPHSDNLPIVAIVTCRTHSLHAVWPIRCAITVAFPLMYHATQPLFFAVLTLPNNARISFTHANQHRFALQLDDCSQTDTAVHPTFKGGWDRSTLLWCTLTTKPTSLWTAAGRFTEVVTFGGKPLRTRRFRACRDPTVFTSWTCVASLFATLLCGVRHHGRFT